MTEEVVGTVFWIGLSVLAFWPLVAPRVRYSRLLLLLLMPCVAVTFPIAWAGYQDRGWELHFWLTVALLAMLFGASHAATRWRFGKVVLGLSLCVFAIGWIVVTAIDPIVSPLIKMAAVLCGLSITGQGISLVILYSRSARDPSQWVNFRGAALVERKGFRFRRAQREGENGVARKIFVTRSWESTERFLYSCQGEIDVCFNEAGTFFVVHEHGLTGNLKVVVVMPTDGRSWRVDGFVRETHASECDLEGVGNVRVQAEAFGQSDRFLLLSAKIAGARSKKHSSTRWYSVSTTSGAILETYKEEPPRTSWSKDKETWFWQIERVEGRFFA